MKKILIIFIAILLLLAVWYCLFYGSTKTLDFRGEVTEIKGEGGELVFTLEGGLTIIADSRTRTSYDWEGAPAITLHDIMVGDTIEGDYRAFSKGTAKYITVWYK